LAGSTGIEIADGSDADHRYCHTAYREEKPMASENIRSVAYKNLGWDSAGDLYLPPNFDESRKYAAIVSTHPIGSCKEQTFGNIYASALAKEGFVVLAFDASLPGRKRRLPSLH
jgi:hypothetical protein